MAVFVVASGLCQMRLRGRVSAAGVRVGACSLLQRWRGGAANSSTALRTHSLVAGWEDGPRGVSLGRGGVGVASMLGEEEVIPRGTGWSLGPEPGTPPG